MSEESIVEVVVPEGSFGEEDEGTWAGLLRYLTRKFSERGEDISGGLLGGEFGYGADFENDVFLMHPFCWCERDDCPWCVGCDCELAYFHGDTPIGEEAFFMEFPGYAHPGARSEVTKRCDYCATGGVAATKGGGPGKNAPNFWHKASGVQVRWYKYIGRSMEIEGSGDPVAIIGECLSAIPTPSGSIGDAE